MLRDSFSTFEVQTLKLQFTANPSVFSISVLWRGWDASPGLQEKIDKYKKYNN